MAGRTKQRLYKLLKEQGYIVDGGPDGLHDQKGELRKKDWDVACWSCGVFTSNHPTVSLSMCSWDTMTDATRYGFSVYHQPGDPRANAKYEVFAKESV